MCQRKCAWHGRSPLMSSQLGSLLLQAVCVCVCAYVFCSSSHTHIKAHFTEVWNNKSVVRLCVWVCVRARACVCMFLWVFRDSTEYRLLGNLTGLQRLP